MTNREFYNAVMNGQTNDEIIAHAQKALESLDSRNAKRRTTLSDNQKANEELKATIMADCSADTDYVASEIGQTYGISTQKASSLLGQLVKEGKMSVADIKRDKKKVKGYKVIAQ